jgi:arginase
VQPPRYAILEAPSVLGLWPSGVEGLPAALLGEGLGARLGARHAGVVEPPAYDPVRDPATGLRNPAGLVAFARRLADAVGPLLAAGERPIVLGGDCSILLGGLLALRRTGRPGLLFLDGQADFYQPEAEPSGEAASMDLALATGRGPTAVTDLEGRRPLVRDEDVVVLGYRDAADAAAHGSQPLPPTLRAIDLDEVRRRGAVDAAAAALAHLDRAGGPTRFWIHLDADVVDDQLMPAVDYRMPGGLTWDELIAVVGRAVASRRCAGLEICIYNPRLDPSRAIARAFTTALVRALRPEPGADAGAPPG